MALKFLGMGFPALEFLGLKFLLLGFPALNFLRFWKKEILVRVILVTENLDPEILDPENLVLGNFKPRNPSAWKGQCMEISEP